ncbi:hypothetical protein ACO1O0_006323 [Amphichorda felina]
MSEQPERPRAAEETNHATAADASRHLPAHSLKRNPVNYVSLVDDPLIKTPSHRVHSLSSFDLTFTLDEGQTPVRLVLEPNHDILHDEFAVTYLGPGGEVKEVEKVSRTANRVFKGRAYVKRAGRTDWSQAGWARITVYRDGERPLFEGAFRIFGDAHHIQTGAHYRRIKHDEDPLVGEPDDGEEIMVVYRDSDIQTSSPFNAELRRRSLEDANCDSDSLDFNTRYDMEMRSLSERSLGVVRASSLFGRQATDDVGADAGANYIPTIGSVDGCPTTRKVALVGIATDCNYWDEFDGDREELRSNVIDVVNRASALYEDTFSISLGIRNLTVIDKSCNAAESDSAPWNLPCSDSVTLNDRLNLFSSWRGNNPDTNAYWSLLTTCNTRSAVGLAWRGQLCREGASDARDKNGKNETVAATNVVVRTAAEWQIFAHETGHTFGAVHDCTADLCPVKSESQPCCPLSSNSCDANGKFIMNPSTGDGITDFSPCSIGNICSGLSRNVDNECLTNNKDIGTIANSQCGNGIVEEGEDCDCGGAEDCQENTCCDAKTCKFRDGAQCDPTNEDCCTDKCQFKSSGTVCRESSSECDPEEKCSGDSGSCPKDEHEKDGQSCSGGLSCASGQCTSRDNQCQAMIGNGREDVSSIMSCGGDDTCMLTCSYSKGANCTVYNQNFLDGTSCGGGGRCNNGDCEGDSTWGRIQKWFRDNKNIAIPVGCAIGALILLAISSCIFNSCRRRSRARANKRARKPREMTGANGVAGANGYWQASDGNGNGNGNGNVGQTQMWDQPPPDYDYDYRPVLHEQDQEQWQRGRPMRYA